MRKNLESAKKSVEKIKGILETDYPIEYNQARENIMERNFDGDNGA